MTNFFRPVILRHAVAAALFWFQRMGVAAAALLFSRLKIIVSSLFKKNLQKFNFFEIPNLYYNIMVKEFAPKAKVFFFWKGNFEGEGKIYFMKKAKAFFCAVFLFLAFSAYTQNNSIPQSEKYSQALKSDKPKDRLEAIYALSSISEPSAETMLIDAYKTEKDAYLKTQILEALSVKNSASAANFILDATEDANTEVRKTAWSSLGEEAVSRPEVAARVRANFKKEKNVSVKAGALRAFCLDKSTSAVKELSSFIADTSQDRSLRKTALEKLSGIKTKFARNELVNISKLKDKEMAREAERLLNKK